LILYPVLSHFSIHHHALTAKISQRYKRLSDFSHAISIFFHRVVSALHVYKVRIPGLAFNFTTSAIFPILSLMM